MTFAKPVRSLPVRVFRKLLPAIVIVLVVATLYALEALTARPPVHPDPAPQPATAAGAAQPQPPKPDPVLATVNGEQIHDSEVVLKMPDGSFSLQGDDAHDIRLKRMVRAVCLRQYLDKEGVQVPQADIDAQVDQLRKYPPSAGCICCRYQSLEQFMQANYYDLKELRQSIANDLGLQKYLDQLWLKVHSPGAELDAFVSQQRPEVEKTHVKVSHIFFNTFQNPDFDMNPAKVRRELQFRADLVLQRIQKGEPFEKLAKEVSQDAMSAPAGGELGCIPFDTFGRDAELVLRKLKPGECAPPVESPYGFHIFRRETLQDKDVLDVAKGDFVDFKQAEVLNNVWINAKIEYPKD